MRDKIATLTPDDLVHNLRLRLGINQVVQEFMVQGLDKMLRACYNLGFHVVKRQNE